MIALVCGGRRYNNWEVASRMLDLIDPAVVVHGAATGADALASRWARSRKREERSYEADWKYFGKAAGPLRNSKMLRENDIDVVVAFPGGRGTRDVCLKAKLKGITVMKIGSTS